MATTLSFTLSFKKFATSRKPKMECILFIYKGHWKRLQAVATGRRNYHS